MADCSYCGKKIPASKAGWFYCSKKCEIADKDTVGGKFNGFIGCIGTTIGVLLCIVVVCAVLWNSYVAPWVKEEWGYDVQITIPKEQNQGQETPATEGSTPSTTP